MMLQTDQQTIDDLGLFSPRDSAGIYDLYNHTHTRGGESLLKEMFQTPLADKDAINKRSGVIKEFARTNPAFPFKASSFDMAEKYLMSSAHHTGSGHTPKTSLGEKEIQQGVTSLIELVQAIKQFIGSDEIAAMKSYADERKELLLLLDDAVFEPALREKVKARLSYSAVAAYDTLFRIREQKKIDRLLQYIFRLDVYLSVAKVALDRKFVFPDALEKGQGLLRLEAVYHPELKNPVANTISMNAGRTVIFLTGANMAGKSTFLRSLGTALYLAHMGFPVAARSMEFSVCDGIYTTINLPDNLGIGASHFYAEVLRAKKVATELSLGKSLFVIFDELFRGTNVKDAHEATVAITGAFAERKNSLFIISSHIVEAGEELQRKDNIAFSYLPTRMNGHVPEYTYTLEPGITDDRHGMIIIRNEGILETLKNGSRSRKALETS